MGGTGRKTGTYGAAHSSRAVMATPHPDGPMVGLPWWNQRGMWLVRLVTGQLH